MVRARQSAGASPARPIAHVAAYLRVSTDDQAESGLGLADQRRRVRGMAEGKGWPEPVLYADEGVSGTKDPADRPALARLLADIHAGQVDALIVLSLDRIGRQVRMVLDLVEEFRQHDVAFVSCKEALDTATPQGKFVLVMFAALAELERDLISQRTIAAMAELGRTTGERGGKLPYGYMRTADGVQVDPAAAVIVRRIFAWHRRGGTLRTIAQRLGEMEVPAPRGGAWRHTSVAEILKNRAVYFGGPRADSPIRWPAILGKRAEEAA
jgi:site-specific DNA recombinase